MESSRKEEEDVENFKLPKDFGTVLASLGEEVLPKDNEFNPAKNVKKDIVLPIAAEIARQEAAKNAHSDSQTVDPLPPEAGQLIEGKGVYLGIWEPTDGEGKSLNKTFDLYAAPEDIRKSNGDFFMVINEL